MSQISLVLYKLLQLSLRLLPPYCLICFSCVLLTFRRHIGITKDKLDLYALEIIGDTVYVNGVRLELLMQRIILTWLFALLGTGCGLMVIIFMQMAGLEKPALLLQFYPNFKSIKLRKKRASATTSAFISTIGCVCFVSSLALGLCVCITSRREITEAKTASLLRYIRNGMLSFKLQPWQGVNDSEPLDLLQTRFKCCGLNSFHDYQLTPRPTNVSWERYFYDRTVAAGVFSGQSLAVAPLPRSCCLTTEAGDRRNCSRRPNELHKSGCYARVLQYLHVRQAEAEIWSFFIGACAAASGSLAYWAQTL